MDFSDTSTALDFLVYLHKHKVIKNMTEVLKQFNMNRAATVVLLDKGVLAKYRNGRQIGNRVKGTNLEYHWKHPDIIPNVNTANQMMQAIEKTVINYKDNGRQNKKSVFIKNHNEFVKTPLFAELCKLREKYEKIMGVKITITAEITTTQKFDI